MARTLSPEDYETLGQSYYKFKQYDKAVEAFTNAIEAVTSEALAYPGPLLYDYRAASYEKLGDFNAAVKDGREAIRADKQDVRGYLRTANTLKKMGKLDTALGIYKYGMKNVPAGHKSFELLRLSHDKLTRQLSPPKAVDPFTVLPNELVEMIMAYLTFKNMVNCLRVSKGWKNYLINRPKLWSNLEFSGARKTISRKFIGNAVRYSQNTVHSLTVVHHVPAIDLVQNIATACKNLHTLNILSFKHLIGDTLVQVAYTAKNLRRITVNTEVGLNTVVQILKSRPNLEHAEFKRALTTMPRVNHLTAWEGPFPNLHTLVLFATGGHAYAVNIERLILRAPALQVLRLANIDLRHVTFDHTSLTDFQTMGCVFASFPLLPSSLKHLVIDPMDLRTWRMMMVNISGPQHSDTRSLTRFNLEDDKVLYPDLLVELLDIHEPINGNGVPARKPIKGEPLEYIRLCGVLETQRPDGTPSALASEPPNTLVSAFLATSPRVLTPTLTTLELPGLPVTDDDIAAIVKKSPNLTTVNVSASHVSGLGIKKLVDGASALKRITADQCRNLGSRDAIDYAESKGVKVSYTMAEQSKGAKKVRYG